MTKDCPQHGPMIASDTQYGVRFACDQCSVACWSGPTSTPADAETRALRHRCHQSFDRLWKSGRLTRNGAYEWLTKALQIEPQEAHIGMFDAARCRQLLAKMDAWRL